MLMQFIRTIIPSISTFALQKGISSISLLHSLKVQGMHSMGFPTLTLMGSAIHCRKNIHIHFANDDEILLLG